MCWMFAEVDYCVLQFLFTISTHVCALILLLDIGNLLELDGVLDSLSAPIALQYGQCAYHGLVSLRNADR